MKLLHTCSWDNLKMYSWPTLHLSALLSRHLFKNVKLLELVWHLNVILKHVCKPFLTFLPQLPNYNLTKYLWLNTWEVFNLPVHLQQQCIFVTNQKIQLGIPFCSQQHDHQTNIHLHWYNFSPHSFLLQWIHWINNYSIFVKNNKNQEVVQIVRILYTSPFALSTANLTKTGQHTPRYNNNSKNCTIFVFSHSHAFTYNETIVPLLCWKQTHFPTQNKMIISYMGIWHLHAIPYHQLTFFLLSLSLLWSPMLHIKQCWKTCGSMIEWIMSNKYITVIGMAATTNISATIILACNCHKQTCTSLNFL